MNPSIVKRCLVGAVLAIAATLPGFQQLHTSEEGLKLIADYEGCRLQPYQCSAGVWTDGIGNTSGVIPGKIITERQAAEGLISNVLRVERALERCVKQQPPQKVYDATVSFAFNVGTGNACSSTLVKLLNQRRWADACRQLPRWVYVKGVFNQGLDSRHMIGMSINLQTSGPHWVGAASYLGEEITIYPYINETIISGGTAHEGGAVHVIDTMRVNP